jgi:hypothetical protein
MFMYNLFTLYVTWKIGIRGEFGGAQRKEAACVILTWRVVRTRETNGCVWRNYAHACKHFPSISIKISLCDRKQSSTNWRSEIRHYVVGRRFRKYGIVIWRKIVSILNTDP